MIRGTSTFYSKSLFGAPTVPNMCSTHGKWTLFGTWSGSERKGTGGPTVMSWGTKCSAADAHPVASGNRHSKMYLHTVRTQTHKHTHTGVRLRCSQSSNRTCAHLTFTFLLLRTYTHAFRKQLRIKRGRGGLAVQQRFNLAREKIWSLTAVSV